MDSSESKSQVTKVLPMENYYARGEGVGDGWSRNAHLPPVSPSGSCSHLQIHQLTHICPHVLHYLFRVKALDSGFPFTLLRLWTSPTSTPRIIVTVSPTLHGISWALLGNALGELKGGRGMGNLFSWKKLEREYARSKRKEKKIELPPTRFKPGLCLQKLPGWLFQSVSSERTMPLWQTRKMRFKMINWLPVRTYSQKVESQGLRSWAFLASSPVVFLEGLGANSALRHVSIQRVDPNRKGLCTPAMTTSDPCCFNYSS